MRLCAFLILVLALAPPTRAADTEPFPDLNLNDPIALREASRVLEDELKLAGRPQTYLLIDLPAATIHIKGRGIVLYRIPIRSWSATFPEDMAGVFRLLARPPVVRRKIDPTTTAEREPISLADMPTQYVLSFRPPLDIDVVPSAEDHPFSWIVSSGKIWWRQLKDWGDSILTGRTDRRHPHLQLSLSFEHAQSLAWSLVDEMPLVIRRSTETRE
jgi:hypothetical protein